MAKIKKRNPVAMKFGAILRGAFFPAFVHVHFRYARHNFKIWAALFIAPFLVVKLVLVRLLDMLPDDSKVVWHYDLLAILTISIFFFLAERFDGFRRVYVWAVPVTVFLGLIYWSGGQGSNETTGRIVKFLLIAYLSYRVAKVTTQQGYTELDAGADEDYYAGKAYYDASEFEQAIPHLDAAAHRGHFKSQYLLGKAYEKGHHVTPNLVKSVAYYYRSSRKGYTPASERYQTLFHQLSPEEKLDVDRLVREMTLRKK